MCESRSGCGVMFRTKVEVPLIDAVEKRKVVMHAVGPLR